MLVQNSIRDAQVSMVITRGVCSRLSVMYHLHAGHRLCYVSVACHVSLLTLSIDLCAVSLDVV